MTLLIVGSRSITDFDLSPYVDESVDCIISGGAKGVDSLAETYANQHGLAKKSSFRNTIAMEELRR